MVSRNYREYTQIKKYAGELRKNQTESERRVWELLRKRQILNYRFLRQHPIFYRIDGNWVENFVADFYCRDLALIIEVDGKIHDSRKEYDLERDSKLESKGLIVRRITNELTEDLIRLKESLNEIICTREAELRHLNKPFPYA
jgi:very-short-patch-repair endonuclease